MLRYLLHELVFIAKPIQRDDIEKEEISDKIEDLWLNLLDLNGIENLNKYTVFRKVHYQGFRNVVLKDPLIAQVIREADSYKDSGLACMNPAKFLEQIYDIRRNCHA